MNRHLDVGEWTAEELEREDHTSTLRYSNNYYPEVKRKSSSKKKIWALAGILLAIAITVAVAVPLVLKKRKGSSASGVSSSPSSSQFSGGSGSLVTQEDGTTFTYTNNFGGDWAFDPKAPFANGGKAQNWSKRIGGEEWVWGQDVVRGVNLGLALN